MNLTLMSAFANPADIQMDSRLIGLDEAKAMVYVIMILLKGRLSLILLGCGILVAVYAHKRSNPPYFTHLDGRKMRLFPYETRYSRFTHG